MELTIRPAERADMRAVKGLFRRAFPPEERPPFFLMALRARQGKGKLLAVRDGEEFAGFLYLIEHEDLAYLFFLAVAEEKQGKGYGTEILRRLREEYRGRRVFLARETLDETAENYDQRVRRHGFYLRCGFVDLPIQIKEADVVYDAMGLGGGVTAAEYDALITGWTGKWLRGRIDMRVLE